MVYEIGLCNVVDLDNGYSFIKVVCILRLIKYIFVFVNFFVDVFNMLKNFIVKKEIFLDI